VNENLPIIADLYNLQGQAVFFANIYTNKERKRGRKRANRPTNQGFALHIVVNLSFSQRFDSFKSTSPLKKDIVDIAGSDRKNITDDSVSSSGWYVMFDVSLLLGMIFDMVYSDRSIP